MCGGLVGDGHKGTDVAIRDLAAMAEGVEVRAAAAGVVDALRDGEPDTGAEHAAKGKDCGNGIRLDHGDGWTTWYCHLRRGSLMVAEGDAVEAGQPLGLVGLSGDTSFPHLHFDVRRGETIVDPFVGLERTEDCGPGAAPLWRPEVMSELAYQPVLLTTAGVATAAPDKDDVRRGWHRLETLPATSPALVLWVEGYWVEPGDRVSFRLVGPDDHVVVEHTVDLDEGKQRWFGFAGAKRPGERWPPGAYSGEVTLRRGDEGEPVVIRRTIELDDR